MNTSVTDKPKCSVEGCSRPGRFPSGLCRLHSNQAWRQRQPKCSVDNCPRQAGARGLCPVHYKRWREGFGIDEAIPQRMKRGDECSVDGCDRPVQAKGMCTMHYQRVHSKGESGPAERRKAKDGEGYIDKNGYRYIQVNGRKMLEHRAVMEEHLGRYLWPWENIHHRNGRRADNRVSNLELWITPPRSGQRIEDLVAFLVEHYPEEVRRQLRP